MMRQYAPNKSHVFKYDAIELDDRLTFVEEPLVILTIDVRRLYSRVILVVKVHWSHFLVKEVTSKTDHDMREQFPVFKTLGTC
uniref:Putative ovule protein n=1 Tax=Solanum chacoense TaxID=4108 RepID=A0A0V0IHG9_SOLCH